YHFVSEKSVLWCVHTSSLVLLICLIPTKKKQKKKQNNTFDPGLLSVHTDIFNTEPKDFTSSLLHVCHLQKYTDLATIDNMDEMKRLITTVNGTYSGSAWIGLYDDVNSWRWSLEDNDFYQEGERDFRNWYHEPDNYGGKQLCVYMDYTGNWFDISCDNTLDESHSIMNMILCSLSG
uniref:C-type lectin domain-containing protein n=1 Tax=Sinocyclocheilus rhinocerous TaxID=307959 RepID=A0A673IGI0_9TELE